MTKLTKSEKKLVALGSSSTRKKMKAKGRTARLAGTSVALTIAALESQLDEMIPEVPLPVVGDTKVTTIGGAIALGGYVMSKDPGVGMTSAGMTGLVLVGRAL